MPQKDGSDKSLFDEILEKSNATSGVQCHMGQVMIELSSEDRERMTKVLADPKITTTAIALVLRTHGYKVSESGVRRHRRKICTCQERV